MFRKSLLILTILICLSCGPTVIIPPEIDLIPYERIGLISFTLEDAEGQLDKIATQLFLQEITSHHRGVQIIELGNLGEVLEKVDKATLNQEAAIAIGEQFDVTSFFYGNIYVSDVKPKIDISALIQSMRIQASFSISMTARFLSTELGATLWTDSVHRKESVAYMSMGRDHIPNFDVRDQGEAYRELVERLIHELTQDFRPTKRRL
jgi:hypothetical protein